MSKIKDLEKLTKEVKELKETVQSIYDMNVRMRLELTAHELYNKCDAMDKTAKQELKPEPKKEIYTPWKKRESLNVAIGDYLSNEDIIVIHGGKFAYSDNVMDFNFAIYYKKRDMLYLAGEEHIYSSNLKLFLAPIKDVLLMDYKLALKGIFYDKTKLKIADMGVEKGEIVEIEKRDCSNCDYWDERKMCKYYIFNSYTKERCTNFDKWESKHQPKPPIIGELAIFWDKYKKNAVCAIYADYEDELHYTSNELSYGNAILYESVEQYKNFIK